MVVGQEVPHVEDVVYTGGTRIFIGHLGRVLAAKHALRLQGQLPSDFVEPAQQQPPWYRRLLGR